MNVSAAAGRDSYSEFIKRVVSTEKLCAIWCGETWATAADPDMPGRSLFLVWSTKKAATESLDLNRGAFPQQAEVDWIDLQKWIDLFTRDLVNAGALVMVDCDRNMIGVAVSPRDLARDIKSTTLPGELQGSDISRIKKSLR